MNFFSRLFALLLFTGLLTTCIGDDVVDDYVAPQIRITNPVVEIEAGTTYRFESSFLNNVGREEAVRPQWASSAPERLTVDQTGLATALAEGAATVTVSYEDEFGETVSHAYDLEIGASTVVVEPMFRTGRVETTTFYDLEGDFTLAELPEEENGDLRLSFGADYFADNGLPGLFVYLSNNPNSTSGAFEIGEVTVFSGAHDYVIDGVDDLAQYRYVLYFCKPFNVKVGHGEIVE